jgi:hypothetical protein
MRRMDGPAQHPRRTIALVCVATVLYGCSSTIPRPIEQAAVMSDYKGWLIRVTPSVIYDSPNLWRASVRVWPPEVRPQTHPGIDVGFSGATTERTAVEQAASAVARRYIDASLPVHRQ